MSHNMKKAENTWKHDWLSTNKKALWSSEFQVI